MTAGKSRSGRPILRGLGAARMAPVLLSSWEEVWVSEGEGRLAGWRLGGGSRDSIIEFRAAAAAAACVRNGFRGSLRHRAKALQRDADSNRDGQRGQDTMMGFGVDVKQN
jgi:hypothetical protein